jgi:large subunit ribosomal protein L35
MPKVKTHKGVAKRFRVTRTGKVLVRMSGKGHLMASKRGKTVRQLRKWKQVTGKQARAVKQLLGKNAGV